MPADPAENERIFFFTSSKSEFRMYFGRELSKQSHKDINKLN